MTLRNAILFAAIGLSMAAFLDCGRIGGPYGRVPTLVAPRLTSPADGSSGLAPSLALAWSRVDGAGLYSVQLSTANSFASRVVDSAVVGDSLPLSGLLPGCSYFWRVRARTSRDSTEWSTAWAFTTAEVSSPQ